MPQKRKSSALPQKKAYPCKKNKQESRLTKLPPEVLNLVLSYCLPDPSYLPNTIDPLSTSQMFTQPILQTSRYLRKMCLEMIDIQSLWIVVQGIDEYHMRKFRCDYRTETIPPVELPFQEYISQNAAKIHLSFGNTYNTVRRSPRISSEKLNKFIFPYNFSSVVRVCDCLGEAADGRSIDMRIECYNVIGNAKKQAARLVLLALSTPWVFSRIVFDHDGQEFPGRGLRALDMPRWNPRSLLQKAEIVRRDVNALESKGYKDEADILLLESWWIVFSAGLWLPGPEEWRSDGFEEEDDDVEEVFSSFPSDSGSCRNVTGNRLRSSVHQIRYRSYFAYISLADKYGRSYVAHKSMFVDLEDCLLEEPHFKWYGLTPTELSEYHYGQAIMYEEQSQKRARRVAELIREAGRTPPRDWKYVDAFNGLAYAVIQMFFALMLHPSDGTIRERFKRLKGILNGLNRKEASRVERQYQDRFSIVYDESYQPSQVLWAGDRNMLAQWGGPQMLQYMSLTQRGLDGSSTFTDWWNEFHRYPESTTGCIPNPIT